MNHTRWKALQAQKEASRAKKFENFRYFSYSPNPPNDPPILAQSKNEVIAVQPDGSIPLKTSWKKVIDEDERQLDIL